MSDSIRSYVFMGLKHCGKSTQGAIIAEKMGIPFVDSDVLIEQQMGMTAREIYAKKGMVAFTLAEERACEEIKKMYAGKSVIVAAGGGICDNAPALTFLREVGPFVFLNLNIDYAISRVESRITRDDFGNWSNLPAYVMVHNPKNMEQVHEILFNKFKSRIDQYAHIADLNVPISKATIEVNTEEILSALR